MITAKQVLQIVEPLIYGKRKLNLVLLALITVFFSWQTYQLLLHPHAGFDKQLPTAHPYIQNFKEYRDEFGGANVLAIAVINQQGSIYNADFLAKLKAIHSEVFNLPGVDRASLRSLFSADTRYAEVVEGGFAGGRVIPADYTPTAESFAQIERNVQNSAIIGRLVTIDHSGAMVVARLLDINPQTKERLNYKAFSQQLETQIRQQFQDDHTRIHIIGFAKVVGEIIEAAAEVVGFFLVTLLLTALLLWLYCGSLKLAFYPLISSFVAVIWELGLLKTAGYGLDPFAILIPFLVLAVGVSHGVQMVNAWVHEKATTACASYQASLITFRRLAIPGTAALITDVVGFATIYMIQIPVIQEMALNAAFGMAAIIVTNKVMMPILLSYSQIDNLADFTQRQQRRDAMGDKLWQRIAGMTETKPAVIALIIAAGLLIWAIVYGQHIQYGDFKQGVPELRPNSVYNQDSAIISQKFTFGDDVLSVIVQTKPNACIDYQVMENIDRFTWHISNTPGVVAVMSLPQTSRVIGSFWNNGNVKMRALPRDPRVLVQNVKPIPSSSGMLNTDCSLMPINIFTQDHKATTIDRIINAIESYVAKNGLNDPTGFTIEQIRSQIKELREAQVRWKKTQQKATEISSGSNIYQDWNRSDLAALKTKTDLELQSQQQTVNQAVQNIHQLAANYTPPTQDAADEAYNRIQLTKFTDLINSHSLTDMSAETLQPWSKKLRKLAKKYDSTKAHYAYYRLASGNVGVMAAANDEVRDKEKKILLWVYAALIIMCWLSFRSIAGVLCVLLPLSLVSLMAYAVMTLLEIGLKVSTLPVAALAVGIGIDYGIYIYSTLAEKIAAGDTLRQAYFKTMQLTGKAVVFTGVALGISVCTWLWSDLQFQRDMGVLLIFMFVANMFGAIFLLPALARFLLNEDKIRRNSTAHSSLD